MKFTSLFLNVVLASRFFDDLPNGSGSCTEAALHEIKESYPGLEECYAYTSLFFGTSAMPCSSRCLDITVQASKRVADACHIQPPNANNPIISNKERVYALWGDRDAVNVVCAKQVPRGGICLNEFSRVSSQLALPADERTLNAVTPAKACNQCSRDLYNKFKSNGFLMPILYYQTINDPTAAFKNLASICGY
ncbi:hypothetical protein DSO57_1012202 [Entomophthora muscae]|uniref:Uncharacterized protein n=1 Tax=Entomophthora muscae TaxID=34485 RepID=A0ACC2UG50_9FUNG|nr:hypothetical protein DSO57_1012202 [Entomophthora muscae]